MSITIEISEEMQEYLASHGKFGESYEEVIRRRLMGFTSFLEKREIEKNVKEKNKKKRELLKKRRGTAPTPTPATPPKAKSPKGGFHTQEDFKPLLLKTLLLAKGNQLPCKDAIDVVGQTVILTEEDKSEHSSGSIRWRNNVQWLRANLVNDGFIFPPEKSQRGIWKLTPVGVEAARRLF